MRLRAAGGGRWCCKTNKVTVFSPLPFSSRREVSVIISCPSLNHRFRRATVVAYPRLRRSRSVSLSDTAAQHSIHSASFSAGRPQRICASVKLHRNFLASPTTPLSSRPVLLVASCSHSITIAPAQGKTRERLSRGGTWYHNKQAHPSNIGTVSWLPRYSSTIAHIAQQLCYQQLKSFSSCASTSLLLLVAAASANRV